MKSFINLTLNRRGMIISYVVGSRKRSPRLEGGAKLFCPWSLPIIRFSYFEHFGQHPIPNMTLKLNMRDTWSPPSQQSLILFRISIWTPNFKFKISYVCILFPKQNKKTYFFIIMFHTIIQNQPNKFLSYSYIKTFTIIRSSWFWAMLWNFIYHRCWLKLAMKCEWLIP